MQEIEILFESGSTVTYLRPDGSVGVMTINTEKSRTQQQFKDECDINVIMSRYDNNMNLIPPDLFVKNNKGVYGDFSTVKDYQSSLNQIIEAEDSFMALPAKVRAKFNNNPQELFAFLNDKKNYDEAINLGLITKPDPTPAPSPTT